MDYNALRSYNWETLKRNELGSSYLDYFSQIYSMLNRVSFLITEFETVTFIYPDNATMRGIFTDLIVLRDKTKDFKPQPGETTEASQARASALVGEVRDYYNRTCPRLAEFQMYSREEYKKKVESELVTFKNQSQETVNNNQALISNKISELDQKISQADQGLKRIEEIKSDIEKLNKDVQNFSLTETVAQYGDIFLKQAKKNRNIAAVFGILFLILVLATITLIIKWFIPLLQELSKPENIQNWEYYLFAFLIRFSVIFFIYVLIREILKNYNTNMHMYHLNSHRNNSLQSFDILVRNNSLPENRDEVVKEISRTIFAHQEDGYLSSSQKDVSIGEIASLITALKK